MTYEVGWPGFPTSTASLLLVFGAAVVASCGAPGVVMPEDGRAAYLTPIARAESDGLTAHWLGSSFDSGGGVAFELLVAQHPEGVAGLPLMGIELAYSSATTGRAHLDVSTFDRDEWERNRADIDKFVIQPHDRGIGFLNRDVEVAGAEATLTTITTDGQFNGYRLIVSFPDAIVIASTRPSRGGDGTHVNPFDDEATFLAAMQELRPYPD